MTEKTLLDEFKDFISEDDFKILMEHENEILTLKKVPFEQFLENGFEIVKQDAKIEFFSLIVEQIYNFKCKTCD